MKTDLKANAPIRGLQAPSFAVTNVTTDAGLNVKPLVDQEVQIGPKFPGPQASAAMLKATTSESGALVDSAATGAKTTLIDNNPKHTNSISGDPTAGSTKHGKKKHDKSDDADKSSQAVLDAAKAAGAADQAYIDAQNEASKARGDLGTAQNHFDQAQAKSYAAYGEEQKNKTPENEKAYSQAIRELNDASSEVSYADQANRAAVEKVTVATVAKNKADADLAAAQAAQASQQNSRHSDSSSKIIPAPNGNTGITGIGLPHAIRSSGSPVVGMDTSDRSGAAPAPVAASTSSASATPSTKVKAVDTGVDLTLENIELATPTTLVAGPAYKVKFHNQGSATANKFQVAILAGFDGKLTEDAPRATIEVPSLAAGEAKEVTLRLPQAALRMTGADGQPAAFTHLFVAVDLMNAVAETDETNNTAVVERGAVE
jgi:hypothetical protein